MSGPVLVLGVEPDFYVNPITHLATVVRGLMDGSVPAGEIGWVLVSSVLLVAVFGPITMVLYRNKK